MMASPLAPTRPYSKTNCLPRSMLISSCLQNIQPRTLLKLSKMELEVAEVKVNWSAFEQQLNINTKFA